MSKRKQTEEFILKNIKKLTGTDFNVKLYKDLFKSMSDKEFDEFMTRLNNKEFILNIIAPHDKGAVNINVSNNLKMAKEFGHDMFQHKITIGKDGEPTRRSKYKYFTYLAPVRRMKQIIEKGISVSEHDRTVDLLTGQVTGESRASKISFPELQLMIGMGMDNTVLELFKSRGGDEGGMRTIKQALLKYGNVSRGLVDAYSTGVISTKTLKAYFNGMHLKINLIE